MWSYAPALIPYHTHHNYALLERREIKKGRGLLINVIYTYVYWLIGFGTVMDEIWNMDRNNLRYE
jgi:hypothetical protein